MSVTKEYTEEMALADKTGPAVKSKLPIKDWEIANRIAKELHASGPLYKLTRKQRRREKKRIKEWNNKYGLLCEQFVSQILNLGVPFDSDEGIAILGVFDSRWRAFIRLEILTKYDDYKHFKKPEVRESILNKLNEFADKFTAQTIEQNTKPVDPPTKAETVKFQGDNVTLEEAITMLKNLGVKTQAKTAKGIQKAIDKLSSKLD